MEDYNFNAEAVRDRLVAMIKEHAQQYSFDRVVLGISGGKDSTVAAALCANAANALKNYAQAAELFAQAYELDKNNFELLLNLYLN